MNRKFFNLAVEERTAEVVIFGDITSWRWQESDVSSFTLSRSIRDLDVDTINVHINSYGGEVSEGLAIHNALKNHPAKIRTICDGFACSAASLVFMAGDERLMNSASLLMIHNAWSAACGNAEELRKAANDLETISAVSAETYRAKVNIGDEELERLLAAETWIRPQEAVTMGFATAVIPDADSKNPSQNARKLVFDRLVTSAQGAEPPTPERNLTTFLEALSKGRKA